MNTILKYDINSILMKMFNCIISMLHFVKKKKFRKKQEVLSLSHI